MPHNRFNIYTCIHKGMRAQMGQYLIQLGQVDETDPEDVLQMMVKLKQSLKFFKNHMEHENKFIHPLLVEFNKGIAPRTEQDHSHHELVIDDLLKDIEVLNLLPQQLRQNAIQDLYRNYAIFVAENLEHMHIEETENAELLWKHLSDKEIIAIEQHLVSSISRQEAMESLMIMLPNLSVRERHTMLSQIRQSAGEALYEQLVTQITPLLNVKARHKLNAQRLAVEPLTTVVSIQ
jgi:hypothetical protein